MKATPPVWTKEQCSAAVSTSASAFRAERLAVTDEWATHYKESRAKFAALFQTLSDLTPAAITHASLAGVYKGNLGEALRYLAGPPISDDDLKVLADVDSLAPTVLANDPAALKKVFDVIAKVVDPFRFPWVQANRAPSPEERNAALLASAVLLAAQRIATERRNEGKETQEAAVKAYLKSIGFTEVPPQDINTIVKGPQANQFCGESKLGTRKADVVVRLHDTRLMPIECKVSNSETNSIKRLNNDAAAKAKHWLEQFGEAQVVPAAVLSGVFKVLNLEQAQAEGLAIFWAHDLGKLGEFIESTREG